MDLFPRNGIRPPSYDYAAYKREYKAYADALAPLTPGPRLRGGTWCTPDWLKDWAGYMSDFGGGMNSVAFHRYPESKCHGSTPTLEGLMAEAATAGVAAATAPLAAAANKAGVAFHIGEGNSVSCGGAAGVSDVFGSALWAVDVLFSMSVINVTRW